MPAPLSQDLRERIVAACLAQEGSHPEIAERFGVSRTTVERLVRRVREDRGLEPDKPSGRPPLLEEKHLEWIKNELERDPFISSYELTSRFTRRFRKVRLHRSTILRAMHDLGFTFKKNTVRSPT